jgi:D-alanyl-D-alanine dipeptidase
MTPIGFALAVVTLAMPFSYGEEIKPVAAGKLKLFVPEFHQCRQVIIVTVKDWKAASARLSCFERTDAKSQWQQALPWSEAVVGRNGLGWGFGLHGGGPIEGISKREGDGRAPAGAFLLHETFGYATAVDAAVKKFPYRQLTASSEGIDDVNSRYYNRIVDSDRDVERDWKSSEKMLREDDLYRWGVVVAHNWRSIRGLGSCIFLHQWNGPNQPTAGCTAMPADRIEAIVHWLDREKHPILVQLPAEEYNHFRKQWTLP